MATIHLIVGYMGFGKTTLACRLEQELPAIRFTHDEFMCRLYGRNMPDAEFRAAWQKVDDLIWMLTEQIVKIGGNVVLDYGFWSRDSRRQAYQKASEFGADVFFHQLRCNKQKALARVLQRTADDEESLVIDRHCFEKFWPQYEEIADDENYQVINYDT